MTDQELLDLGFERKLGYPPFKVGRKVFDPLRDINTSSQTLETLHNAYMNDRVDAYPNINGLFVAHPSISPKLAKVMIGRIKHPEHIRAFLTNPALPLLLLEDPSLATLIKEKFKDHLTPTTQTDTIQP